MIEALNSPLHPRVIISELVAHWGSDLIFTYSTYTVAPPRKQATAPRSPTFRIRGSEVTPTWVAARIAALKPYEELAWHSSVEQGDRRFHIPMIDFAGQPGESLTRQLDRMMALEMGLSGHFLVFESGRASHGYFSDLLPQHRWPMYLGNLLLFNDAELPELIDSRWIGHSLVKGFSALRWSNNTPRYLALPRLTLKRDVAV